MRTLNIDIETYSPVNLKQCGVYAYSQHPEFEILIFGYSYDGETVLTIDMAQGELLPDSLVADLYDPEVIKKAFNATFERICIGEHLARSGRNRLPIGQWRCTMVLAAMVGLPMSLDKVGEVLHLEQQKSKTGTALIKFFSVPCKPSKVNGMRTRNLPEHDPEKWQQYKDYNRQDVVTEMAVGKKLKFFTYPEEENILYALDQEINDRGVKVDYELAFNAIKINAEVSELLMSRVQELTGLENPNSVPQLKKWLEAEIDEEVASLGKTTIPPLLKKYPDTIISEVLTIRQRLGKTSVSKYMAMVNARSKGDRVRGITQYYGAGRTGRFAGRFIQPQNLPQNHIADLEFARNLVKYGSYFDVELLYGNVQDTLSQLIRTALIPEGLFYIADYSAIEARVSAYLADEKWVIDVFATHGKIYEATAANMFHVDISEVTKGSPLRQKGKIASLALSYGGSVGALTTMDSSKSIPDSEKPDLVKRWRAANPNIVKLWYQLDKAAKEAIKTGRFQPVKHGLGFSFSNNILYMHLPSGRKLCYIRPFIGEGKFGQDVIYYEGMDQTKKKWCRLDTYGGKLLENATQAVARDCLTTAMIRLNAAKYRIVFHVHDEVISDNSPENAEWKLKNMCKIMGEPIPWAPGLYLRAEGYTSTFYKKD